ncbi:Translin family-domain-containing protein [Podospora fimiseda]|uniref:Translin family-domain-containing protein n=1 Tax=Podospora fimiseda TaxID=252190 RepID=A0AAN7H1J6_9PEZI|nr:Translin family-domain-containing protein [Podospora fimiseda]
MSGYKRDWKGNEKKREGGGGGYKPATQRILVQNEYTPMFDNIRAELDEHHDRRERIVKLSRDITALSKKIIFTLQRVRKISPNLPKHIQSEVDSRLTEISKLLALLAPEIQGINRHRYARSLSCLEELAEALTFAHYLKTQTLISPQDLNLFVEDLTRKGGAAAAQDDTTMTDDNNNNTQLLPAVDLTQEDYLYGVFDLTGEMMRFATTSTALSGTMGMASAAGERTIVEDMHELGSFFEMLPVGNGNKFQWYKKLDVTRQSVKKVERLGYDRTIRGSERPAGWVPDLSGAGDMVEGEERED